MLSSLKLLDEMPGEYEEVIWLCGARYVFRNDWNASTNRHLAPFVGVAFGRSVDDRVVEFEILQHCVSLGRGPVDKDSLFLLDCLPDKHGNLLLDSTDSRSKLEIGTGGIQGELIFACT